MLNFKKTRQAQSSGFFSCALILLAVALSACGQKHESIQPQKKDSIQNADKVKGPAPKKVYRSDVLALNEKTANHTTVSEVRFTGEAAREVMERLSLKEIKKDKISRKVGYHLKCVASPGIQECRIQIENFYSGDLVENKDVATEKTSKEIREKRTKSYSAEFAHSDLIVVASLLTIRFEGKDAFALMKNFDVQSVKPISNFKGVVSYSLGHFNCSMKSGRSTQILSYDESLNYVCTVVLDLNDGGSVNMKRSATRAVSEGKPDPAAKGRHEAPEDHSAQGGLDRNRRAARGEVREGHQSGTSEQHQSRRHKSERRGEATKPAVPSAPVMAPVQRGMKTPVPLVPQSAPVSRGTTTTAVPPAVAPTRAVPTTGAQAPGKGVASSNGVQKGKAGVAQPPKAPATAPAEESTWEWLKRKASEIKRKASELASTPIEVQPITP